MKKQGLIFCLYLPLLTYSQNRIEILQHYLTALHDDNGMNGNIVVVENGNIVYKNSFGYADFANQKTNTDASLFPLASISKTFTAIAVLQLKEKSKIKLDDPFAKYFKDFPYPGITIRQLLSHTSGLPDMEALFDSLITKQPDKIFTNADIIPALIIYKKSKSLPFQTGEKWGYSNVGYQLLALLIEKISRIPFAEYMKRNIFIPAGMANTYVQTSLAQTKDNNRTLNYQYNNHFEMKLMLMDTVASWKEWTYNLTGLTGSTNVISNVMDLVNYDRALYSGKLINTSSLEEAFTPTKLNNGENNKAANGSSYGLGWFIKDDPIAGKTVSHSGAAPGVSTLLVRNLSKKQTVIILHNVQAPPDVDNRILDILNDKPVAYKVSLAFAYARNLYLKGTDYASSFFNAYRMDTLHYYLSQAEMDRAGLEFSRKNFQAQALETYKINTLLFPESWRTFNSYGNALLRNGKKEEALLMFERSIALNPNDENGKTVIKQIKAE